MRLLQSKENNGMLASRRREISAVESPRVRHLVRHERTRWSSRQVLLYHGCSSLGPSIVLSHLRKSALVFLCTKNEVSVEVTSSCIGCILVQNFIPNYDCCVQALLSSPPGALLPSRCFRGPFNPFCVAWIL